MKDKNEFQYAEVEKEAIIVLPAELIKKGYNLNDLIGFCNPCIDSHGTLKITVYVKDSEVRKYVYKTGYFIKRKISGDKTYLEKRKDMKGMCLSGRNIAADCLPYVKKLLEAYQDFINENGIFALSVKPSRRKNAN